MNAAKAAAALAALVLLAARPALASEPALGIGSAAPALTVAHWAKGDPVPALEKGKVYVVEFWATWCGPCKESIPHLTEMAHKFKDVTFIGVSVWEDKEAKDDSFLPKVDDFVKQMGDKMDYHVGADDRQHLMEASWATAAEIPGIPSAFVVDKTGKIAWIGHPMDHMDDVLTQVVAGKWDVDAARKDANVETDAMAAIKMCTEGKLAEGLASLDKLIAEHPRKRTNLEVAKFDILLGFKEADAYPYMLKLAEGDLKDDAMSLNAMAWPVVEAQGLKNPDFAAALKVAERAVKLTKGENPMILDTLGYALYRNKRYDEAVKVEQKAADLASKAEGMDPDTLKEIKGRLDLFQKKGG